MRVSAYFRFAELVHSDTARERWIANRPPTRVLKNLRLLATGLDRVRRLVGYRLEISSGYRSPPLNRAVGGSQRSRHQLGLAADFVCRRSGTPLEICRAIQRARLPFAQLIYEFGDRRDGGWVHIAFGRRRRRQVLTIRAKDRSYRHGIRPSLRR